MTEAVILATCKQCGDVTLTASRVTLVTSRAGASFGFTCPLCRRVGIRECSPHAAALLAEARVPTLDISPTELPPLSAYEIAAFSRALDAEECPARLAEEPPPKV